MEESGDVWIEVRGEAGWSGGRVLRGRDGEDDAMDSPRDELKLA
jgi:hypothetical protein